MKKSFWLFGSHLTILESYKGTDSSFDFIEGYFPPGMQTPVHIHSHYSETLYVVSGQVTVYVPGESVNLSAGESFFIPINTPHAVVNNSNNAAFKALVIAAPAGFAHLISSIGIEGSLGEKPTKEILDMEVFMRVSDELGDVIIGPPGARP